MRVRTAPANGLAWVGRVVATFIQLVKGAAAAAHHQPAKAARLHVKVCSLHFNFVLVDTVYKICVPKLVIQVTIVPVC